MKYSSLELSEHYCHSVLREDIVGCRICDAIAQQYGSLLDNDRVSHEA